MVPEVRPSSLADVPHTVSQSQSSNDKRVQTLVQENVFDRPIILHGLGRSVKKRALTPIAKSLVEKIAELFTCITGKSEIPELELLRRFQEHHECTLEQLVPLMYAGKFTLQTTENSEEIATHIRHHFAEVRQILGEKKAKKFLYLFMKKDCAEKFENFAKWQECIQKMYGPLGEQSLVCDHVIEKTEDFIIRVLENNHYDPVRQFDIPAYLRALQQLFSELQEHPLGVKRINWHLFLAAMHEQINSIKGQISELKRFPCVYETIVTVGLDFPKQEIFDEFHEEKKMVKRLGVLAQSFQVLLTNLQAYQEVLSSNVDRTSSYDKNPFIHIFGGVQDRREKITSERRCAVTKKAEKFSLSSSGIWDVATAYKAFQSVQQRWKAYQGKLSEILDKIVPEDFLNDISRVSFFFGGESFRIATMGGHNLTPEKVFKHNLALNAYLKQAFDVVRKPIKAAELNLLRYELQDIAQQGVFNADPQFLRAFMQDYQKEGLHAHDATHGVQYHFWASEGSITLKAEAQVAVFEDKERPAIGFDALEVYVTIDTRRYKPSLLLTEQDEGVVKGYFRKSGFIQSSHFTL
jgi:hypothetical protein